MPEMCGTWLPGNQIEHSQVHLSPTLFATACGSFSATPVPLFHQLQARICHASRLGLDDIMLQPFNKSLISSPRSLVHDCPILLLHPPARLPASCYHLMLSWVCWPPRLFSQEGSNLQPLLLTTAYRPLVRSSWQNLWTPQMQAPMHPKPVIPSRHHYLCPSHPAPRPHLHCS